MAGPGIALQRWLRLRVDPALVLPIGFAYAAMASWAAIRSGHPWLFPFTVLTADLGLLWPWRPWQLVDGPSVRGALPPFLAVVAVLAAVQYPLDRRNAEGDFVLDDLERIDTAFHVGVTWELAAGYPPQVPGLAGLPLSYHVGPHLIRAAAYRWAGTRPYDALYRFDVTLSALALILALRGASRAIGAGSVAVALVGWTPLATDFAFVLGALTPGVHWWTELLRGNLLLSLVFANSVVSALAMAAGVIIALERHRSEEGRGWLLVAAALGAAIPFFKVFLGAQMLLGLAVAVAFGSARKAVAAVFVPSLLAMAWLAVGKGAVQILLDPLAPVALTREMLGQAPLGVASLLAWTVPWLVASLGLRIVGLPSAVAALRSGAAPRILLAALALCGWPLAMLVRITADGTFNESVYFTLSSGALLWIFAASSMGHFATDRPRRLLVAVAGVLLALPATAEFVWRKTTIDPDVVPGRVMRAMAALEGDSRPGDVVLMRPFSRYPPPPLVFIGRRVAFTQYMPYMRQFAPETEIRERERDVREFFRTDDADAAFRIARGLNARYVYLFGAQTIEPSVEAKLDPLYIEDGVRLYRIPGSGR